KRRKNAAQGASHGCKSEMRPAPAGRKKEAGGPLLTAQTGGAPFLAFFARSGPLHCQQSGRPLLEHREKRGNPSSIVPNGQRKLRWADARRGKGRRGGLRIIYYHFPSDHQIWLMTLYNKDEASDLTAQQKKALKIAIETELAARAAKRATRPRG